MFNYILLIRKNSVTEELYKEVDLETDDLMIARENVRYIMRNVYKAYPCAVYEIIEE